MCIYCAYIYIYKYKYIYIYIYHSAALKMQWQVLMLEIAFHFPPPFRFSAHWDVKRSHSWNAEYDVDQLNPSSGCSLSYAIHKFKPFGYHLLRLTHTDAVFVHESVRPSIESGREWLDG